MTLKTFSEGISCGNVDTFQTISWDSSGWWGVGPRLGWPQISKDEVRDAVKVLERVSDSKTYIGKDLFRKSQAVITNYIDLLTSQRIETNKMLKKWYAGTTMPVKRKAQRHKAEQEVVQKIKDLKKLLAREYPVTDITPLPKKAAIQVYKKAGIKPTTKMISKLAFKLTKIAIGAGAIIGIAKLIEMGIKELKLEKKAELFSVIVPQGSNYHRDIGWY